MLNVNLGQETNEESHQCLERVFKGEIGMETEWLGSGETSNLIIQELKSFLNR